MRVGAEGQWRQGMVTGVLVHECQGGARVHEGSSHVTIPSVDGIMQEFYLRGFPFPWNYK